MRRGPVEECLVLIERQTGSVDRLEYLRREPLLVAHRVERVVDPRQGLPTFLEHHGNAAELDIGRQLRNPGAEDRLEIIAVRAAVREEFDHLDFLPRFDRLSVLEPRVILAFDGLSCARRAHRTPRGERQ